MRTAAKRDTTEPAIIAALEGAACQVQQLSGADIPDLLVCLPSGDTVLVECKSKGGKLRRGQEDWLKWWRGRAIVAYTAQSALEQLELMESGT